MYTSNRLPTSFIATVGKLEFLPTWQELVAKLNGFIQMDAIANHGDSHEKYRVHMQSIVSMFIRISKANISWYSIDIVRGTF